MTTYTCVCQSYLSSHPCRIANYLVSDFNGELKLLGIIRSGLRLVSITEALPKHQHNICREVSNELGDIRLLFNLMRIPSLMVSLHSKWNEASRRFRHLEGRLSRGRPIQNQFLLKVWISTCGLTKSTLSLAGKSLFKPIELADRLCSIGGEATKIAGAWKYLSIIKNGAKIGSIAGELSLSLKGFFMKVLTLLFSLGSMLKNILKLSNVTLPKPLLVVAALCDLLFKVYKVYDKTA